MRLVEDDGVVVGQHRGKPGVAEREVGKEQMVIDHYQLGALRASAYARREAVVVVFAARTDTGV